MLRRARCTEMFTDTSIDAMLSKTSVHHFSGNNVRLFLSRPFHSTTLMA
jgi:predicted SAM-dependent methyltransferase